MLVFVTAVKHPDNSESYDEVWQLLNNTLFSVCSQTNLNFRVIVVCDKKRPLFHHQELINKYTDFIEVDFPSHGEGVIDRFNYLGNLSPPLEDPTWWKQWSLDANIAPTKKDSRLSKIAHRIFNKAPRQRQPPTFMSAAEIRLMANYALNRGSKQLIGIVAAKKYNPEYVLIFDADDYVGNDIAAYVNSHPGQNGWIMSHGYKLSGNLISPFYTKSSFCGTGNILSYALLLEDIPPEISAESSQDELFTYVNSSFLITLARHGHVLRYYRRKSRLLHDYPSRGAVHLLSHGESNDFHRRQLRGEAETQRIITAQRHAAFSPITPDLVRYFNILPKNTYKVFCFGFFGTSLETLQELLGDVDFHVSGNNNHNDHQILSALENGEVTPIIKALELFDALIYTPWLLFYKELDRLYPNSKFILNTHDLEIWKHSFLNSPLTLLQKGC